MALGDAQPGATRAVVGHPKNAENPVSKGENGASYALDPTASPGTRTPDPLIKSQLLDSISCDGASTSARRIPNPRNSPSSSTAIDPADADLRQVVEAWPGLAEHLRAAILTLATAGNADTPNKSGERGGKR